MGISHSEAYAAAGVDIEAGYQGVKMMNRYVQRTLTADVISDLGGFGGLFSLDLHGLEKPVLVSGTDGVGTKQRIAQLMDRHNTVGIDCVAMCVNDIIAQGAQPLFFLDYIAVGKNSPEKIEQIVKGVADGCVLANCALVGGETAEMPDMYGEEDYDIAGFAVGAVEKSDIITGEHTRPGDVVIGLASSGVHSNGFSLVRKIVLKDHQLDLNTKFDELQDSLGNTLLTPTRIYVRPVLEVLKQIRVHGIAHITGGGFDENMPRCLNAGLGIHIRQGSWTIPPVFDVLQRLSGMDRRQMFNVFNMGIGMILVVDRADEKQTLDVLRQQGETAWTIGEVVEGEGIELR